MWQHLIVFLRSKYKSLTVRVRAISEYGIILIIGIYLGLGCYFFALPCRYRV